MLCWIALIGLPSAEADGNAAVHVTPASAVRSKCTRHVLGLSGDSVLLGATSVPSESCTSLFLIGPSMPSGRRRASLQVFPLSRELRTIPHQLWGLGPTL